MKTETKIEPEQVGRKYEYTRWGILTRMVNADGTVSGDGSWYGRCHFKTESEALAEWAKAKRGSGCYQEVGGGLAVDLGPDDGTRYEKKLVKVIHQAEVLGVCVGPA